MMENGWPTPASGDRGLAGGGIDRAAEREVDAQVDALAACCWPAPGAAVPEEPADPVGAPGLGFIGSEATYDALRGKLRLTLLTRRNWRAHLHAHAFGSLLIEPAPADATGEWGTAFLGELQEDPDADALLRECGARGIAVFGWLECAAEDAVAGSPVLRRCDRVFCSTPGVGDALQSSGVEARTVGVGAPEPPCSPADGRDGGTALRLAFTGLAQIADDPEVAHVLETLTPFGLELFDTREEVPRALPVSLAPLAPHVRGGLLPRQVPSLLGKADVLLQAHKMRVPDAADYRDALQAALHGAVVVVIGEPAEADPRLGYARFFHDPSALRAFLSRLQGNPLERDALALASWRSARALQRTSGLAPALRLAAGADAEHPVGRLSLLAVLRNPAKAAAVLEDVRAQQGEERDLVLLALGGRGNDWDDVRAGLGDGERIVRLSSAHAAGAAVLAGAHCASGDHVVILRSGVRLGASMMSDLRLALAASGADVALKPAAYAVDGKSHALLRRWGPAVAPAAAAIRRDRVADLVDARDDLESLLANAGSAAARLGLATVTLDGLNALHWLDAADADAMDGWRPVETSSGHKAVFR